MTTQDIIKILSQRLDHTQSETQSHLKSCTEILCRRLESGRTVRLPGLGSFSPRTRKARRMRHPLNSRWMLVPPKRVVRFRPSSGLTDRVRSRRVK